MGYAVVLGEALVDLLETERDGELIYRQAIGGAPLNVAVGATRLGSDVPFALLGGTAHGTGHGEIVEPVPDKGTYWWVVVPDDEGLSTPAVYREYDRTFGRVLRSVIEP
jgi:hypothetical protein